MNVEKGGLRRRSRGDPNGLLPPVPALPPAVPLQGAQCRGIPPATADVADLRIPRLALSVVGFAGLFVMFSNADNITLVVAVLAAFFGGGALGGFCAMAAAEEAGITGHFAWYPGPTKHKVEIHRQQEQVQLNAFVCGRCGHRERFWVASARSEAEQRMREHTCL